MPFYIFAWIGAIFYGTSIIVGKITTKYHIANPWLFNFVWNLFTLLFIIPFALYAHVGFPQRWDTLWLIALFNALSGLLYILSLYRIDISILAPLYAFRTPVSVLLGVVFLGEKLAFQQLLFITVIVFSGMFVSIDEHLSLRSFFKKPIGLALLTVCISAIYGATVKNAMAYDSFWEVTLWSTVLTQVVLLITLPKFRKEFSHTPLRKYQGIIASAFFIAIGTIAAYKAYQTNIGITSAILFLPFSMIFVFLLSLIAPKFLEKHSLKVYAIRFIATGVMIFSAIRLSM